MNNSATDNIKEIAEELDCGFCTFVYKTTGQVLFVSDTNTLAGIGHEMLNEELEQT